MITNKLQYLANECVRRLEDKRQRAFSMYCGFIRRFGFDRVNETLSEVVDAYRCGRIKSKVKVFMSAFRKESQEKGQERA